MTKFSKPQHKHMYNRIFSCLHKFEIKYPKSQIIHWKTSIKTGKQIFLLFILADDY